MRVNKLLLGLSALVICGQLNAMMALTYERSDLWAALRKGDKEAVEQFFRNGAQVDEVLEFGQRPLHVASHKGHKDIVEFLISRNATIDSLDDSRHTPLMLAALGNHPEIIDTAFKLIGMKRNIGCIAAGMLVDNKIPIEKLIDEKDTLKLSFLSSSLIIEKRSKW